MAIGTRIISAGPDPALGAVLWYCTCFCDPPGDECVTDIAEYIGPGAEAVIRAHQYLDCAST